MGRKPKPPANDATTAPSPGDARYDAHRKRAAERASEQSAAGRDIAPLPKIKQPKRREGCARDFKRFCETYLADRFTLAWSADHLKAINRIEVAVLEGGRFAYAMPRGSGKTTLCEAAALWALLYAHRRFVVLIGATEGAAEELLDSFKVVIETNDLLLADFPAVVYPIRRLEGISHRANGQTFQGERTRIGWTQGEVVLPTVPGSPASGSLLRVAGITGRVRGMRASTASGEAIRPDLVIVDDPQTDESARSPAQNNARERILGGAVLGLAGPGRKIAAVMPCTVISAGDLAERTIDRDRSPEWQGERTKLIYRMPTNERAWEEYARIRAEGLREGRGLADATAYYLANRTALDEGAEPAWVERYNPDEASAVQHAMNLYLNDPISFAAEYQNEPRSATPGESATDLDADAIASKLNRLDRGIVPSPCTRLTCGIDVQGGILFYVVAGWDDAFGGAIIDYGTYPRQNRAYFAASDARPSLADTFPDLPEMARVYAGLAALTRELFGRAYPRENDQGALSIERSLVDANWGASTDTVYQFVKESPHTSILLPSHGKGIGASAMSMNDWPAKPGERAGWGWRLSPPSRGRGRRVLIDVNAWKTFVAERLRSAPGVAGCLSLPGTRPFDHQLFADHLTAEYRVSTSGRGRTVEEWKIRPDRTENHWWDCLILAAVAASIQGLVWSSAGAAGVETARITPRTKTRLSDLQRSKRGRG